MSHIIRQKARNFVMAIAALAAVISTSCDSAIYEYLDPCPQGVSLRFVYDYNMEFANAFPSQVDCLTVLIYDSEGGYKGTRTVTDPSLLGDENWRMAIDLAPGDYTLVAYGGMECDEASFAFGSDPASTNLSALTTALDPALLTTPAGTRLHHLFYGRLDVTVADDDTDLRNATVEMMKDTNNLRILLQHVDGTPVIDSDFTYTLTAPNTKMDSGNNLIATDKALYMPWTRGQVSSGLLPDGSESILAFAEFSTGRFVGGNDVTLTIASAATGRPVLSIPLINYLLLLKSQEFESMGAQEFLDRESRWNMVFFLDNRGGRPGEEVWINTSIIINDWVVRINDIDL